MIRLQIQHTRTFAIVQRFGSIITAYIISHIVIDIVGRRMVMMMMKIGTRQYYIRIIIATNDIWFFCGTIFCYNFHVRFMAGS